MRNVPQFVLSSFILVTMTHCATMPRKPALPMSLDPARPAGLPAAVRFMGLDEGRLAAASSDVLLRVRAAATDGTVDILALSWRVRRRRARWRWRPTCDQ